MKEIHKASKNLSSVLIQLSDNLELTERMKTECSQQILKIAELLIETFENDGKVLLCGNGGSAADAQHLACELVVKLKEERRALPALALSVNLPILSAVSNDIGFEQAFSRQVEALGRKGDVLVAISTSGSSKNVILAAKRAKEMDLLVVAFTGEGGRELSSIADLPLMIPSLDTQRIQEGYMLAGHIICGLIEKAFKGKG